MNNILLQVWIMIKRWNARHQAILVLSKLDDHALKDIGLNRYDIPSTVDDMLNTSKQATMTPVARTDLNPQKAMTKANRSAAF